MDYEQASVELLRALRGKRSQAAFSRRLGYRSNIVSRWENRRCWPTAAGVLRIAARAGVNLRTSLDSFLRVPSPWLDQIDLASPSAVVSLLEDLRGKVAIVDVAREAGFSRFSVSRWLKGLAEPKLPQFLHLIDVLSLRLLDFLAAFVDPRQMPSVASAWSRRQAAREAAFARPWSHAVLRALELASYQALPAHEPDWIARSLGISGAEERRCLELLEQAGQIRSLDGRWSIAGDLAIDLRSEPEGLVALKAFWLKVARTRLQAGASGTFGFNLFAASEADLVALRELHVAYFQQMQARIARSEPSECVALFSTQLVRLA